MENHIWTKQWIQCEIDHISDCLDSKMRSPCAKAAILNISKRGRCECRKEKAEPPVEIQLIFYYKNDWYSEIKNIIGKSTVISVGLDPMIAPMNDIASLDGYYPEYPREYKHQFREIIKTSLVESGMEKYYDNWGSRVYTFHKDPETIDFCAAKNLGVEYVISSEPIMLDTLKIADHSEKYDTYLFQILCDSLEKKRKLKHCR